MKTFVLASVFILASCVTTPKVKYPTATAYFACVGAYQGYFDELRGTFGKRHLIPEKMFTKGQKFYPEKEFDRAQYVFSDSIGTYANLTRGQKVALLERCHLIIERIPGE